MIDFLPRYDDDDRTRGAEPIGHMLGFAQRTDTRMPALVGDADNGAYELLFSFNSKDNKSEFLRLIQSNDATACEKGDIILPRADLWKRFLPEAFLTSSRRDLSATKHRTRTRSMRSLRTNTASN